MRARTALKKGQIIVQIFRMGPGREESRATTNVFVHQWMIVRVNVESENL